MTKTFDKKEGFAIQQVSHPGVQRKNPNDDAIVCFGESRTSQRIDEINLKFCSYATYDANSQHIEVTRQQTFYEKSGMNQRPFVSPETLKPGQFTQVRMSCWE